MNINIDLQKKAPEIQKRSAEARILQVKPKNITEERNQDREKSQQKEQKQNLSVEMDHSNDDNGSSNLAESAATSDERVRI